MTPPFPFNFPLQRVERVEESLIEFIHIGYKRGMQEYRFDKRTNANDQCYWSRRYLLCEVGLRASFRETCLDRYRNNGLRDRWTCERHQNAAITDSRWIARTRACEHGHAATNEPLVLSGCRKMNSVPVRAGKRKERNFQRYNLF